ncbi:MAG TPA: EcsC family protein [Candidatus Acidoferrum sp.]|nr:EcsC family protein [Candidatus Acidoferrum sp.]
MRSIEINREDFRRYLARKHKLHVTDFRQLRYLPVERLDSIAAVLIRDAQRLAFLEGAGFGFGGMITLVPDAGLLTLITLRLIQRLCLLYGFDFRSDEQKRELWLAAAAATGIDFGKDLAEKQLVEKIAPMIVERLAVRLGAEAAEKWVARLVPLASSALCGGLNFGFVRAWGRRVQRNLHAQFVAAAPSPRPPLPTSSVSTPVRAILPAIAV